MAFVEGVANSYADLLTAIETAMLANGWTKSGTVLHADGCFVELAAVGTTLTLRGGAGLTGSSALQDPGPSVVRIGNAGPIMQMVFPAVYHVALHASPREVYLHVNYDVDRWQWMAFGKSPVTVPNSGVWYAASFGDQSVSYLSITPDAGGSGYGSGDCAAGLFWGGGAGIGNRAGFLHSGVDGVDWCWPDYSARSPTNNCAYISTALRWLMDRQPNSINGAAIALPAQVWQARTGNTISLVGDFAHCRVMRVDNYAPAQVMEYGADRWRVYPFFRKSTVARDGGSFAAPTAANAHTGTMGMAVRYDGP